MKKKIHPLSVVFIIVGILGIAFAGLCVYNEQIPYGLIVLGCSMVMFVFPSLLNKPADDADEQVDAEPTAVSDAAEPTEPAKKQGKAKKELLLGEFTGRCRMPDKTANDCILRVSTNRIDFVTKSGHKLVGMLRSSIQSITMPNSHALLIVVSSGEYKFISNDTSAVKDAHKLLTKDM